MNVQIRSKEVELLDVCISSFNSSIMLQSTLKTLILLGAFVFSLPSSAYTTDDFVWDFEWLEPSSQVEIVIGEPYQLKYTSRTNTSLVFTKEYAENWNHYDLNPSQHIVNTPTGYSINEKGVITGLVAGKYAINYTGLIQAKSGTDKWLYITVVSERSETESNNTLNTANDVFSKIRFGLYNPSDVDYFKFTGNLNWGDYVTFKIHYYGSRESPFGYKWATFSGTNMVGGGSLTSQDQECKALVTSGNTVYLEIYYDPNRTQYFNYGDQFVAEVFINGVPVAAESYTISVSSADKNAGSVSGSGEYKKGATVTVEAIANEGYEFEKWSNGSVDNPYTFEATDNIELVAHFKKTPKEELGISGTHFIKNAAVTGTDAYLEAGRDWGTHAVLGHGIELDIIPYGDGEYKINTDVYNGENLSYLGSNGFMDVNSVLYIQKKSDGLYTISSEEGLLLSASGTWVSFESDGKNTLWQFVTPEEREAELKTATKDNPQDATWLIKDPDFSKNDTRISYWNEIDKPVKGGKVENQNAERWGGNTQTFTVQQTINLPNGWYKLSAQGFYRYNNTEVNTNDVAIRAHINGTEVINSCLFAGDVTEPLPSIVNNELVSLPFSQAEASDAFNKGLYTTYLYVEVKNGQLPLGVKKIAHPGWDWTVFDNFELTYYGTNMPDEADAIKDVTTATSPSKSAIYSLSGIRRTSLQKGVNIVDGKKVMVK